MKVHEKSDIGWFCKHQFQQIYDEFTTIILQNVRYILVAVHTAHDKLRWINTIVLQKVRRGLVAVNANLDKITTVTVNFWFRNA